MVRGAGLARCRARGGAAGRPAAGDRRARDRARRAGRRGARAVEWGAGKDLSTWDSPAVAELAFAARRAELRTVARASGHARPRAALERAARELLAIQSSDWAFMVTGDLASDYSHQRLKAHLDALEAALAALADSAPAPDPNLRHLAPDLDLASLATS